MVTDPEIGARDRLQHVGEILAAHLRLRTGQNIVTADHGARHIGDHLRLFLIVDEDAENVTNFNMDFDLESSCDSSADGSRIEAVVHEEVNVPVIGGLAGDDTGKAGRGLLFMDGMHLKDAVVMLAVDGPLAFQIHLGNSMSPVGTPGIVDDAEGMMLRRIGGMEAVAFVEQQTGKSIMRSDQGIALKLIDPDDGDEQKLRAVNQAATADTSTLTLFGGIRNGSLVQVCMARPDALETEVHTVAAQAMHSNFVPAAALIISCAGRKWLMGGHIEHEVRFIEERFQHCLPLAGFPSFGEIGPMARKDGYTRNLFHNMTFVLLLLGTEIRPCAC